MDALILSCGTGGGHDSAAKALLQELQIRGHKADILNPYTLYSENLAQKINNLYISMVQNTPRLFGAVYTAGQFYRKLPCRSPVYFANRRMIPIMEQYLSDHHYDFVMMTHLYPAEIMTNMKNRGIQIPKTIFISTDYVCIPFTEETECDAYIIPAEDLMQDYIHRGIPKEKLYPYGIPVNSVFEKTESKAQVRQRLNLYFEKKYILIAGGSMGGGTIQETIHVLLDGISDRQDMEVIIICGNNKTLYDKLSTLRPQNTIVIGYTKDMAGYMRAADLFITKPGGLSSTEAAVCGIPILHTAAIPGCELYNAEYFCTHGMSNMCRDPKEVLVSAMELLNDQKKSSCMVECQQRVINGNAAANICKLAENLFLRETKKI